MKICSVKECVNKCRSNSSPYCEIHYYRLRRTGTTDERKRSYSINENILNNLSTEKAWVLGLIWSDGNIDNYRISITSKDLELLQQAERILEGHNCIKERKASIGYYDLAFNNKKIAHALRRHGLLESKSLVIQWPKNLPTYLEPHFIRGVFDGDGCISINKQKRRDKISAFIVSGSLLFANSLVEKLQDHNIHAIKTVRTKQRHNPMYTVYVYRVGDCHKLYNFLYRYKRCPRLERKFDIFHQWHIQEDPKCGRISKNEGGSFERKYAHLDKHIIDHYINVSKCSSTTAEIFSCSSSHVLRVLKSNGVKAYSGRSKAERLSLDNVRTMIEDKRTMTWKEMQIKYGLHRKTMSKAMNV